MIVPVAVAASGIDRSSPRHYPDEGPIVAALAGRASLLVSLRAEQPEIADRFIAVPAGVTEQPTIRLCRFPMWQHRALPLLGFMPARLAPSVLRGAINTLLLQNTPSQALESTRSTAT